MRTVVLPALLACAACASTRSSGHTTAATTERQNTTVTYTTPDGRAVNINLETRSSMETRSFAVHAAPQELWRALPLAYQDLGIALAAYDSVQLYLGNPGLAVPNGRLGRQRLSRYLNCGSDPLVGALADRYDVRLNVVSRVRPGEGVSLLETQVTGHAAQRGVSSITVGCVSTGALEEAISNAAKLRLAGGHPPR